MSEDAKTCERRLNENAYAAVAGCGRGGGCRARRADPLLHRTEMPLQGKLQFGRAGIETVITTVDVSVQEVIAPEGEALVRGAANAQRIVRVRNTGDHPLYVRMKLGFACVDAQGAAHPIDDLVKYASAATGDSSGSAWVARGIDGGVVSAADAFAGAPTADGYLYLARPLAPGELSAPVVTGLVVDTEAAVSRYGESSTYRLAADAHGVQSENQTTENVLEVEGWPEA